MFEFTGESYSRSLTKRLTDPARAETLFRSGGGLMAKRTTKKTPAPANPVAVKFGEELQARCKVLGISREEFYSKCEQRFPKAKPITFSRWWNGKKLPQRTPRGWFEKEFGIVIPETRDGEIETVAAKPAKAVERKALMEFATGSIGAAVMASDEQIVHDVADSLKDPEQNPWMRIAVTLIRQAHLRSR